MIVEWVKRIIKKWFWTIGFLPLVLDLISAYIPQENIPQFIANFLSNGGNWNFTLTLVTLLLLVASYLVYSDEVENQSIETSELKDQISVLQNALKDYQNSKPLIDFGLIQNIDELHKEITVDIKKYNERNNFDDFFPYYRNKLLAKYFESDNHAVIHSLGRIINRKPKDVYEEDIDRHIEVYKEYLERKFAAKAANSIAVWIRPIAVNEGRGPAEKLTFIISLPKSYQHPSENVYSIAKMIFDGETEFLNHELVEPSQPSLNFNPDFMGFSLPSVQTPDWSNLIEKASNVVGPSYSEESNGNSILEYEIKELIQHRPEKAMEPFLLWLESINESTTWELPVKITSASLQEPIYQKITININLID